MAGPELEAYLAELRALAEAGLERSLRATNAPAAVAEPMRYSLMGPGKRLRPCLALAVADAVADAGRSDPVAARWLTLPGACAVEMIHAYSLVHDDLPAMDNDALRRGRPTTHVVYGDGPAILAGDGLLTDAFAVLLEAPSPAVGPDAPSPDALCRLEAAKRLARAAGSIGMVGGQAIDLASEGRTGLAATALSAEALEDMHARKTGALIRAAATLGAVLPGAPPAVVDTIDQYATDLGLAFQIVDDILDVEGASGTLGKTAGKDAAAGKATFPAAYGLAASKQMAADCIERAVATLTRGGLGGRLPDIARWSLRRTH